MKLHIQVAGTAMVLDPSEPEWSLITALPGYQGPDRQYLLGRTCSGKVHLCIADGWKWIEASPDVSDEDLIWLLECTERHESRQR